MLGSRHINAAFASTSTSASASTSTLTSRLTIDQVHMACELDQRFAHITALAKGTSLAARRCIRSTSRRWSPLLRHRHGAEIVDRAKRHDDDDDDDDDDDGNNDVDDDLDDDHDHDNDNDTSGGDDDQAQAPAPAQARPTRRSGHTSRKRKRERTSSEFHRRGQDSSEDTLAYALFRPLRPVGTVTTAQTSDHDHDHDHDHGDDDDDHHHHEAEQEDPDVVEEREILAAQGCELVRVLERSQRRTKDAELDGIRLLLVVRKHFALSPGNNLPENVLDVLYDAYVHFLSTRHLTLDSATRYGAGHLGIFLAMPLDVNVPSSSSLPWIDMICLEVSSGDMPAVAGMTGGTAPVQQQSALDSWREAWCVENGLSSDSLGETELTELGLTVVVGPASFCNHGCTPCTTSVTAAQDPEVYVIELQVLPLHLLKGKASYAYLADAGPSAATVGESKGRRRRPCILPVGFEILWSYRRHYYDHEKCLCPASHERIGTQAASVA